MFSGKGRNNPLKKKFYSNSVNEWFNRNLPCLENTKGNSQFIFLCNPPNVCSLMFVSWKYYKALSRKKVMMCFNNLGEENFLKVAAFVIFPTSIMIFFENTYNNLWSNSLVAGALNYQLSQVLTNRWLKSWFSLIYFRGPSNNYQ